MEQNKVEYKNKEKEMIKGGKKIKIKIKINWESKTVIQRLRNPKI